AAQNVEKPFYLDVGRGRTGLYQVLSRLAEIEMMRSDPMGGSAPPSLLSGKRGHRDVFCIQINHGRGNLRQARLQCLDITHPGTRRWFHADRRFSTGLRLPGRSA
ncbi:MAG: hypothetical protein ACPG31_11555, partial [Planctomycetota bacterium]